MNKSIVGFRVSEYKLFNSNDEGYKNIVPLESLTEKQLYELACDDCDDAVIYDNVENFIYDLNNDWISTDEFMFYTINH